jgi:serine/threonine protein kinase
MKAERERQIDELFHSALELNAAARGVFLEKNCADEELRGEIESLLDAFSESNTLLAAPAASFALQLFAQNQTDLLIGKQINQYKIVRKIGAGGMGEVYLAEDSRLNRKVALKILPSNFRKNSESSRRFEREARAISALNHPGILTIHEIVETENSRFIVTEFIDGETLRERIKASRIDAENAIAIGLQIISALDSAHAAGIVHRDIKPENIMIRADGFVKILDFGIVKLNENFGGETFQNNADRNLIFGTARYMSPEQIRGLEVDSRTDLWSFGVVFYEMLAGAVPFQSETKSEVVNLILHDNPPPLRDFAPEISEDLERIVEKCLAKDRERRYRTAQNLYDDLSRLKQRRELEKAAQTPEIKIPFETIFLNSPAEQRKKITLFLAELADFAPLTENLGAALMMKAQLAESAETFQTMLEIAAAKNDNPAKARAFNGLALVQDRRSETAAMLESAQQAEHFARLAGQSESGKSELITALVRQGYAHYRFGNAAEMFALSAKILELATGADENGKRQKARGFNLCGTAHRILGEFDMADFYCHAALEIYRELNDKRSVSNSLNFSGEIARLRGDYAVAVLRYTESLEIAREIGERVQQLTVLGNLGGAFAGMEDYATAEKILREVIETAGAAGYYGLSENYAFLATALAGQDKASDALDAAQTALRLAREARNQEHLGGAWRILGIVLSRSSQTILLDGKAVGAKICFAESLKIFKAAKMKAEIARTLHEMARMKKEGG